LKTILPSNVESPAHDELVHQHGFTVSGWFVGDEGSADMRRVEARIAETRIGSSRNFFDRPDVRRAHPGLGLAYGFEFSCRIPEAFRGGAAARVDVYLILVNQPDQLLRTVRVRYSYVDYRTHGHGYVLTDGFDRVLHREDIYGSGPPSPVANGVCLNLVLRYIGIGTVLDMGCGIGAYGRALLARGYDWHGVEVTPDYCDRMTAEGLPNTLIVSNGLPFTDGSFESAISIEVLEHVDDYKTYLREMSRVVRGTACFSVPNAESIPIMSYMQALPWHMLEADHKSFFSLTSLEALLRRYFCEVEVFPYGTLGRIRSFEGVPIPNHLFAVARGSRG
jgi:2-polyprenyl-3-methyl-5-hydroxy-6-metoxy-1,4-benzoquinol methylase